MTQRPNFIRWGGMLAAGVVFVIAGAPAARAESIPSMSSLISLNRDGSAFFIETVTYDFGDTPRHGIYRDLPIQFTAGDAPQKLSVTDVSVTDLQGAPIQFDEFGQGGQLRMQIGDPDTTITGAHTYVIRYRASPVVAYGQYVDELAWNVVGSGWNVPVADARAEIIFPDEVRQEDVGLKCFVGEFGSTEECRMGFGGEVPLRAAFISSRTLAPGESMTVVASFPTGIVARAEAPGMIPMAHGAAVIAALAALAAYFGWTWWTRGRDAAGTGVSITQFEPPAGLSPSATEGAFKGRITDRGVTAELLALAVAGRLRILEAGGEHTLALTDPAPEGLREEAALVLARLTAAAGADRTLSAAGAGTALSGAAGALWSLVGEFLYDEGYYRSDPARVQSGWAAVGGAVAVAAFVAIGPFHEPVWGIGLFVAAAFCFAMAGLMTARTAEGARLREDIDGFKRYLSVAERDRLAFHHPPDDPPERFEALLPYAVALGVETQWAKAFADVYRRTPEWLPGQEPLSAEALVARIAAFSRAAAPARPGSRGGHFAGGGRGGGGGGSW